MHTTTRHREWRIGLILGGLLIAAAGAWVLIDPPQSYRGLGEALTTAWGTLLTLGGVVVSGAYWRRSYKVEMTAMPLIAGGLAVYSFLSWQATLGDSPGSGPRALILTAFAVVAAVRLVQLLRTSRDARWVAEVKTE